MKKPYIIGLKFDTWRNEIWFSAEDDAETEKKWEEAVKGLEEIGNTCTSSNEFLPAAVEYFEEKGFSRIQR